jgi:hypothetical protein
VCYRAIKENIDDSPTTVASRRNSHRTHLPQDHETTNDEKGKALVPSQARTIGQIAPVIAPKAAVRNRVKRVPSQAPARRTLAYAIRQLCILSGPVLSGHRNTSTRNALPQILRQTFPHMESSMFGLLDYQQLWYSCEVERVLGV